MRSPPNIIKKIFVQKYVKKKYFPIGIKKYIKIKLISEKKDMNIVANNSNLPSNNTDV